MPALRLINIGFNYDGNCLFRSCSYHFGTSHTQLRSRVVKVIREHPTLMIEDTPLQDWISIYGHNPETYVDYISRDGVYGTALELSILSILYKRTILVFSHGRKRRHLHDKCQTFKRSSTSHNLIQLAEYFPEFGKPAFLLFIGDGDNGHYEPLDL